MSKKKYPAIGKLPRKIFGVTFQEKSDWQKDNCITNSLGGNCNRKSVIEAVHGDAIIRCCTSLACKRFAAQVALKIA